MERTSTEVLISVNGQERWIREGQTIAELIGELQLDPERLAVEFNRRIIKRPKWRTTQLGAGAKVEIVQFVGGG